MHSPHEGNRIGDLGAQALAETLKSNTTMTDLNLDFAEIGNSGAITMAEALKLNKTLHVLNLSSKYFPLFSFYIFFIFSSHRLLGNKIGDSGIQSLAESLEFNCTITVLKIECNILYATYTH